MIFNRISMIVTAIAIATSVFLGTTVLPAMAINKVIVESHAKAQQSKFYGRNEKFWDRVIQEVTGLNVSPQKVSVPKLDKSNQHSDSEDLSYESFWDRVIQEVITKNNFQGKVDTSDILPSWTEAGIKNTIIDFVTDVTNPGSSNFVEVKDRIAVFDNDGTLWSEYPEAPPITFFNEYGIGRGETTEVYIEAAHNFVTTENNTDFGKPYVDLIYQPMVELLDYLRDHDFQL